ncbi:hypothetical protein [Streptomyces sp. STCH 565 A]|uniref:hypothetical protein n=1 Tax=Streptomyces sp. STCH 565 A TaxID=2950532 RepID=UPI002076028B|nr:hypothetical protein [Streptomyces sp. STCH 565 A]MCM8548946.1 hypothetical protein [Streptomyces sp. STCH 565 A]
MHLRRTQPSRIFHVTGGGAGIDPTHPCDHGTPAMSFHLFSEQGDQSEDIGIVLPMCSAPALFGAAVAFIDEVMGSEEGDRFMAAVESAREQAGQRIADGKVSLHAAENACCEAGYRSQGREHTCRPTTPPTS